MLGELGFTGLKLGLEAVLKNYHINDCSIDQIKCCCRLDRMESSFEQNEESQIPFKVSILSLFMQIKRLVN